MLTLGGTIGVLLVVVGLAFGGWPVLIAAAIFVVVGAILLAVASMRRSDQYVEHGEQGQSAPGGSSSGHGGGRPRSGGAPASGEGE